MAYGMPPPGGFGAPPPYGAPPPFGPPNPYGGPNPYGAPNPYGPPGQGDGGPFPPRLADAPRDRRVDETFGWFPASAAVAALLAIAGLVIGAVIEGGWDSYEELKFIGIASLGVVLFGFWEIWRRTHPTSLIVMADNIGVYRKGVLDVVVRPGQLTWFRLNIANSIREYMLFGITGIGGLLAVPAAALSGNVTMAMVMAAVGVGGTGALASAIWSRGMCRHYYVPKGGGTETVVLRTKELQRLGCWPFPLN